LRRLLFSELTAQPAPQARYQDPITLAREKFKWITENHHPEPLQGEQQRELQRILAAADKELAQPAAQSAE
jgi:hypothetical protein